jgi:imidazolonepropionase-like amidohydrolase
VKRNKWILAVAWVALSASVARAQAQSSGATLIKNATLLTITHGTIENGSILIRNGKIAAVGKDLQAPAGATVIDAAGQFVLPGIIDCHSHIAVEGSVNEGSISVSSMANIADVLDPDDIEIQRDLAGGVTSANILHGSANSIGGQTLVIKLRWGQPASKLPFEGALPGIKFALGENPKRSNSTVLPGTQRRYPATRMGVEDTIREAFTRAKEYKRQWDAYTRRKAAGEQNMIPPRRDLQLEPLVEVLEGKRYVHSHCYRADEILMLIRVANEFGFKVRTFQHVLEGYKVAKEIAAHGAGASTFSDWWAYKMEAFDAIPYNAAIMAQKGVVVSINSDSGEEARHLNQEAAKTMKFGGLSELEALKLVTLNPAIQLGIERRVGSIDVGKDADLVIYNKHPLSVYAVPQKVLIDGQVYFDREKDAAERAALEKEKKALIEKEKKAAEAARRRPGQTPPNRTGETPPNPPQPEREDQGERP